MKLELVLKQDGERIAGTLGNERGTVDLTDAKLDGADLSFKITVEGVYTVKLTLSGDSMNLETAVEAPPDEPSPSAASVCSSGICHPLGEMRGS
jgi:hypothetical protein